METYITLRVNGHSLFGAELLTRNKVIVIFCHGYRSSSIGPNRFFVTAARKLFKDGISSLRFDQYGSGNSEGNFFDSSYYDWIDTTTKIIDIYTEKGYKVILFGQSMGGSMVLSVAAKKQSVAAVVSWVPDANVQEFIPPTDNIIEESGQIVQAAYWQEAHDSKTAEQLEMIKSPVFIVQCSNDEYVSKENHDVFYEKAQNNHILEMFEGYRHSSWSYEQAEDIIDKSISFIMGVINHKL